MEEIIKKINEYVEENGLEGYSLEYNGPNDWDIEFVIPAKENTEDE